MSVAMPAALVRVIESKTDGVRGVPHENLPAISKFAPNGVIPKLFRNSSQEIPGLLQHDALVQNAGSG